MIDLQTFARVLFGLDGFANTALYVPQILKTWKIPQGTSFEHLGILDTDQRGWRVLCAGRGPQSGTCLGARRESGRLRDHLHPGADP